MKSTTSTHFWMFWTQVIGGTFAVNLNSVDVNAISSFELDTQIGDIFVNDFLLDKQEFGSNGPMKEERAGKALIVPKEDQFHRDDRSLAEDPRPSYGKGPTYRPHPFNKNKFPRFLGPFPFGFTIRDPLRPFPENSILLLSTSVLIPFIPFGTFELRLPTGFFLNYIIERLNGVAAETGLGRSLDDDQMDLFRWLEDLLSNTFALDGKKCVQRWICELAETPIRSHSLMGEILHSLLDPRKGGSRRSNDYLNAEMDGHQSGECGGKSYRKCPLSLQNILLK